LRKKEVNSNGTRCDNLRLFLVLKLFKLRLHKVPHFLFSGAIAGCKQIVLASTQLPAKGHPFQILLCSRRVSKTINTVLWYVQLLVQIKVIKNSPGAWGKMVMVSIIGDFAGIPPMSAKRSTTDDPQQTFQHSK
jgi:hypothetical protein